MSIKTSGIQDILKYLYLMSPGIILAVAVTGSISITVLPRIGGEYGYVLLWVIPIALIYKFALIYGVARYTIVYKEDFFKGLKDLPGPKNWALIMVLIEYALEMLGFGGLALFAGTALSNLYPMIPARTGAIITVALTIIILRKGVYASLEKSILFLFLILVAVTIYFLSILPISYHEATTGFVPSIPYNSLMDIMALVGCVGGGIGILSYSFWLKEKISHNGEPGENDYRKLRIRVLQDLCISYFVIGAFACAFLLIGSFAFYNEVILAESQIVKGAISSLEFAPHGSVFYLLLIYLAIFSTILGNLDGRSRVFASSLSMIIKTKRSEIDLYKIATFALVLIMLSVFFLGEPNDVIRIIASAAAIIFAMLGMIVIYIDSKLPFYAKGSRSWLAIMTGGSMYFLVVNLLKEESIIEFGIPLLERAAVILFVVFLFSQTETFKNIIKGQINGIELAWIVIVFGSLSIYGSFRGIAYGGYLINIRDLGAIMAGVIGGPLAGVVAGAFGGIFRYTQGGWTALPCASATVMAGLISGLMTRHLAGKVGYAQGILIVIIAELFHIFILAPLFLGLNPEVMLLMRMTTLPMIVANCFGMIFFLYIIRIKL